MNNKGFTLTEIIVVIAIIGVISTVAIIGVNQFRKMSEESIFEGKKDIIVSGAVNYGTDNKVLLTNTCYVDEKIIPNCLNITVNHIRDYINMSETCSGVKCFKNNITGNDMRSDDLIVYIENNNVYADIIKLNSCNVNKEEKCN